MRLKLFGLALLVVCLLALGCGGSGGGDRSGESASTTSALVATSTSPTSLTTTGVTATTGEVISSRLGLGEFHGCVLVGGGGVRCWGANGRGELGLAEVSDMGVDVLSVVGLGSVVSVVAGASHSCVLFSDGSVSCWGNNAAGQLGDGSDVEFSAVPVRVVGVVDAVAVSAGGGHSCVVHSDGGVSCWGSNRSGQLGNGESGSGVFSSFPQRVLGISNAVDVSAGAGRTCVLRSGGGVSCWGLQTVLREGDVLSAVDSDVPVEVAGVSGAVGVSVGGSFLCAVLEGGEVMCWGNNFWGQLGNGMRDDSFVPVMVVGVDDAVSVSAGQDHACVLHRSGDISCWGENSNGILGSPPRELPESGEFGSSVPVKVAGISNAVEVEASVSHSCVLLSGGGVSCWGNNLYGQLARVPRIGATLVAGVDGVVEVSVSRYFSCVRHLDAAVSCWGRNNRGQLGNGTRESPIVPAKAVGIDDALAVLVENFFGTHGYSCVLHDLGYVSCWGANNFGNLGNGQSSADIDDTSVDSLVPERVSGIADVADFGISWIHACAVINGGSVSCWGSNLSGHLGNGQVSRDANDVNGTSGGSGVPVDVVGLSNISKIELGAHFTCALHDNGKVSCWGQNDYGQLGNGQNPPDIADTEALSATPVEVIGISDAMSISVAAVSACVIHIDTTVSCWGRNHRGQLGVGSDEEYSDVPEKVAGLVGVMSIASSESLSSSSKCALLQTGEVFCWGASDYGKLGNGQVEWSEGEYTSDTTTPTKVTGISEATDITAGTEHYCALISDGTVWCWGDSRLGQLSPYSSQNWIGASAEPVQVENVSGATSISSAHNHTCAVIAGGTVKCWGDNRFGQLGDGRADYLPQKVPSLEVSG